MVKARITTDRVGTDRLWNDVVAQHYDYEDRPVWNVQDDGTRVTRLKRECGEDLAEAFDIIEVVEDEEEGDDDDGDESEE